MSTHRALKPIRNLDTWAKKGCINLAMSNPHRIANMLDRRLTTVQHRRAEVALVSNDHASGMPHGGVIRASPLVSLKSSPRHEHTSTDRTTVKKLVADKEVIMVVL
jgi:hypothetical protein